MVKLQMINAQVVNKTFSRQTKHLAGKKSCKENYHQRIFLAQFVTDFLVDQLIIVKDRKCT
jgi:hypothetical protein